MKKAPLHIPDKKYPFFIEEEKEPTKEEILEGLKQAVKEINLIRAGKLKGIDARELIHEL